MRPRTHRRRTALTRSLWGSLLMFADLGCALTQPHDSVASTLGFAGAVIAFGYALYWARRYDRTVS